MIPKHLESYDAIKELIAWKAAEDAGPYRPSWSIGSYAWDNIVVRLSWSFDAQGSRQSASTQKVCPTVQEAAFLALEDWKRWKRLYEKDK